jgi:hypothetical protein
MRRIRWSRRRPPADPAAAVASLVMLERLFGSRIAIAGFVVLASVWGPVFAIGLLAPRANPIGLGLLALACTPIGVALLAVGLATPRGASAAPALLVVARIFGTGLGLLACVMGFGSLGMGGGVLAVSWIVLGVAAIGWCLLGRMPHGFGAGR